MSEYEKSCLGCMIQDQTTIPVILNRVNIHCFENQINKKIFERIIFLYERKEPIETITVSDNGIDREYVLSLVDEVISPASAGHYAEKLREEYIRRQLKQTCKSTISRIDSEELETLIDDFESKVFALAEDKITGKTSKLEEIIPSTYTRLMDGVESGRLKTGFFDLDELSGGFTSGDNIVLAGRPSMGKTALALSMMAKWAREGISSAIFSLETTKENIVNRLMSIESGIDAHRLSRCKITNEEREKLPDVCAKMSEWKIFINDNGGMNTLQLKAESRRLMAQYHPQVLIVDYLQLLHPAHRCQTRNDEVTEISRTLRELPKELGIPVISISQLSRGLEHRETHQPRLSDLRDSGSIEQDASMVFLIYRPEQYGLKLFEDKSNAEGVADINLAKNKDGPTGHVKLYFKKECMKFESLERGGYGEK